ncbi:MAG: hypothetical protein WCT40_03570 [Candidatus Magasanikbacteria bacterium]|jgi:hypothetical protein
MEGKEPNQNETTEHWNQQIEVEKLKNNGFDRAAIYLEDPELVDELHLSDILALNELSLRSGLTEKILFNGKEIDPDLIPSLTTQAINKLRELIPNAEKPLTLEDAFLIVSTFQQHQSVNQRITSPNERSTSINKKYLDPGIACGLFHAAYFYAPFPEHRKPGDIYAPPVAFIEKVISTEPETEENIQFSNQIMTRLLQYYNTELRRKHHYYNYISMQGKASWSTAKLKDVEKQDKVKIADEIKIDLKGYDGKLSGRNTNKSRNFPASEYDSDMEQALHAFIRPLRGTHMEGPEEILSLAVMDDTPFAKKLAEKFREIAQKNPPQYFDPPYTKNWLTQPLG